MPTPTKVKSLPVIIIEHHLSLEMDNIVDINAKKFVNIEASNGQSPSQMVTTPKTRTKSLTHFSVSNRVQRNSADRFIANRKSLNHEYANLKVEARPTDFIGDDVFEDTSPSVSPMSYEHYRYRMACLSEGASEARVLRFGSTGDLAASKGASQSQNTFDPNLTFARTLRRLPKDPEQVLDLPDMENNFFINTVTWGAKNHVIAALDRGLYVAKRGQDEHAYLLGTHKYYPYTSVACSSDGVFVVAGTEGGDIEVWDIENKRTVLLLDKHHSSEASISQTRCALCCMSWKPDSNVFVTGCRSGLLNHFDFRTGKLVMSNTEHKDALISALSFSPSGNLLASTDTSYDLRVWDWTGQHACFAKKAHMAACRALAWNPWKPGFLASGGGVGDGYIRLWNVYSGEKIAEVNVKSQVCSLVWSPITKELFAGCSKLGKHVVSVFSYPDLKYVGQLPGHQGRVLHMGFGPCKTILFTASADEMLKFWKITDQSTPVPVRSSSCTFLSKLR